MKGKGFVRAIVCAVLCCCLVWGAAGCGGGNNANEIENLQKQIDDLKAQITLLQEANAALAQEVNGAKTKLNAVESKIAETEAALATAEQERNAMTTLLLTALKNAEEQSNEIAKLQTRLSELKQSQTADRAVIETLREELQAAKTAQQGLQTKVTQLETALSEKDTEIAALQTELTALTSRVQTLETELAEQKKLLSDLTAYTYGENGGKLYSIGDTVSYVANGVKFFDVTICGAHHAYDNPRISFKITCNLLEDEIVNKLIDNGAFLTSYLYDKTTTQIVVALRGGLDNTPLDQQSNGHFMFPSNYPITGEKLFFLYAGNSLIGIFDNIKFPEENTNT